MLIDNIPAYTGISYDDSYVNESTAQTTMPASGKLKDLKVRLSAPPGGGGGQANDAYTITVRLNGGDTALSCTVTGQVSTTCTDSDEVTVTAGQELAISGVPANTPTEEPGVSWTATFTGS
jgi:hypothetical protein